MMQLGQIAGMVRYEIRIQWRQRMVPAITLGFIGFTGFGIFLTQQIIEAENIPIELFSENPVTVNTFSLVMMAIWPPLILLLLASAIIFAEVVPRDRQLNVRSWLDSLPLSTAIYLTGKVLSAWVMLLLGMAGNAALGGLLAWGMLGPFDLRIYAALWCICAVPGVLFVSGLGVILAAPQPNRRRAMMVGMLLVPVAVGVYAHLTAQLWGVLAFIDPIYQFTGETSTTPAIIGTLGNLALILAAAWVVAWAWLRWRAES